MWENIQGSEFLGYAGVSVAWAITIGLMIVGMVGCVMPVLPGHLILLIAAMGHRLMLGEGSGLQWWSFVILGVLMAISQALEMFSGAAGSKWFGGSRWGALGAIFGAIGGLFFMPFGILVGPLVGCFAMEIAVAKMEARPAMVSGVGSVVGTVTGMAIKLGFGLLMVLWFLADVFWIG